MTILNNHDIADRFELLSKLMTLYDENPFKIRSYAKAATEIDVLEQPLSELPEEALREIPGIGKAIQEKIMVMLETGSFPLLEKYLMTTPEGIIEMLGIKGIGPKKLAMIWREMKIDSPEALLEACREDQLSKYKGFGKKTQKSIQEVIEYYLQTRGLVLFSEALQIAEELEEKWERKLNQKMKLFRCGGLARQEDLLSKIEFLTSASKVEIKEAFEADYDLLEEADRIILHRKNTPDIVVYWSPEENLFFHLFKRRSTTEFLQHFFESYPKARSLDPLSSEEELFSAVHCPYIPPYLRRNKIEVPPIETIIQQGDIRGIIHSHSNWSDGRNTIEEMARATQDLGMEYLVLSDHSQSAGYAGGLRPEEIVEQHGIIDELNEKLSPFQIFKSIESDILSDGSLDYEPEILEKFDLVIASVHSNLKMDEKKAMKRLLRAISNPYTTIIGHLTGRLLLDRPGFPVDHHVIIDACVENQVVIEINAHPRRLDLDWKWIPYALEKGALLSIDPDAHTVQGLENIKYGIWSAQKGGLLKSRNLSSFTLEEFKAFLKNYKEKIK